jgi:hypothetical protein
MPEIDEELGRYLDSLVEPVEPEWVIGWVARRRRRRALVVGAGAIVVAVAAGSIGYALHAPDPQSSVRFGTEASSSTAAVSTTSTSVAPTSTSSTTRPHSPPPGTTATTAPTSNDPYPWPVKALDAFDVRASLALTPGPIVAGVAIEATVTLVNQTDQGVVIREFTDTNVAIVIRDQDGAEEAANCDPELFFPTTPGGQGVLPPHATVSRTCSFTPAASGPATIRVDLWRGGVASNALFVETPLEVDIGPRSDGPTTTTSTSPGG